MSATFTARYPGRCQCGQSIEPGDDVTYAGDLLVHTECADGPVCGLGGMPTPRAVTICEHCHLTKPCDCEVT